MNIVDILTKGKELEKEKEKLEKEIEKNEILLNSFYKNCHNLLLQTTFYDIHVEVHNKPLNKMFNLRENYIPYSYQGEGDFKDVVFSTDGRKLKLLYHYTWDFGKYVYLDTIPLELFEKGREEDLAKHADKTVQRHKDKIENKKKAYLLKQKKDLDKKLQELNNKIDEQT